MAAAKHNITIEQGATFLRTITIKDAGGDTVDITGWTFRGKVKTSQSADTAIATFDCVVLDQGTNEGQATFGLTATVTAAIEEAEYTKPALKNTIFIYDLEAVKPGGEVVRLLQGEVTFVPEITK